MAATPNGALIIHAPPTGNELVEMWRGNVQVAYPIATLQPGFPVSTVSGVTPSGAIICSDQPTGEEVIECWIGNSRAAYRLRTLLGNFSQNTSGGYHTPNGLTIIESEPVGSELIEAWSGNSLIAFRESRILPVIPPKNTLAGDFSFDFTTYPINIYDTGSRFYTTLNPRSVVDQSIFSKTYWVDPVGGSNAANGLTVTTPFKSAWKARQVAEADGAVTGYTIMLMASPVAIMTVCGRLNDFNDTGGAGGGGANQKPTKPFALIKYGTGKLVHGPIAEALVWSNDASGTSTFTATRASTATMIDVLYTDPLNGLPNRMSKKASQALAQVADSGWAQVSSAVYERIHSLAIPTDTNLIPIVQGPGLVTGAVSFYISGIEFWGGIGPSGGCLAAVDAGTRNFAAEDCVFNYPGTDGAAAYNAVSIDNVTGLGVMARCSGGAAGADIFNAHGTAGQLHMVYIDCYGIDAGRVGTSSSAQPSDQIYTVHEGVKAIHLNCRGFYSSGGVWNNVLTSENWILGGEAAFDRGDIAAGGSFVPACVRAANNAKIWAYRLYTHDAIYSYVAADTSIILRRKPQDAIGVTSGGGTVNFY